MVAAEGVYRDPMDVAFHFQVLPADLGCHVSAGRCLHLWAKHGRSGAGAILRGTPHALKMDAGVRGTDHTRAPRRTWAVLRQSSLLLRVPAAL